MEKLSPRPARPDRFPSRLLPLQWREFFGSRLAALSTTQFTACDSRRVFPLFLGGWRAVIHFARRQIDHALRPLVQIARAFGMLLGHVANMRRCRLDRQRKIQPPQSDWPTTVTWFILNSPRSGAVEGLASPPTAFCVGAGPIWGLDGWTEATSDPPAARRFREAACPCTRFAAGSFPQAGGIRGGSKERAGPGDHAPRTPSGFGLMRWRTTAATTPQSVSRRGCRCSRRLQGRKR